MRSLSNLQIDVENEFKQLIQKNESNLLHKEKNIHEIYYKHCYFFIDASVVAFIAPGPPKSSDTTVMYIGISVEKNSFYSPLNGPPIISSRSLQKDTLFEVTSSTMTSGTLILSIPDLHEYIYGFSSEGFSYFMATYLNRSSNNQQKEYVTKLIRVCQNDSNFFSYTEIPIECRDSEQKYNFVQAAYLSKSGDNLELSEIDKQDDMLYAIFAKDHSSLNNSALCVYSLKSIRQKFVENIQSCFNGNGFCSFQSKGILFSQSCKLRNTSITNNFCGSDVNHIIKGEQSLIGISLKTFYTQFTAIAVTKINGFSVVFGGTVNGYVKKISIDSKNTAKEYASVQLHHGHTIKLFMGLDLKYFYVVTKNRIIKLKLYDCTSFKNCGGCLDSNDPYCDLCLLENQCVRETNINHNQSQTYFIIFGSLSCACMLLIACGIFFSCMQRKTNIQLRGDPDRINPLQTLEEQAHRLPYDAKNYEFPPENLRNLELIGGGAFGDVYKGDAYGIIPEENVTKVAVKKNKSESCGEEVSFP